MKKNKLALILFLVAGLIFVSNFIYKLVRFHKTEYGLLFSGIFVIAFGIALYLKKPKAETETWIKDQKKTD